MTRRMLEKSRFHFRVHGQTSIYIPGGERGEGGGGGVAGRVPGNFAPL